MTDWQFHFIVAMLCFLVWSEGLDKANTPPKIVPWIGRIAFAGTGVLISLGVGWVVAWLFR